jgi:hypothetical protein
MMLKPLLVLLVLPYLALADGPGGPRLLVEMGGGANIPLNRYVDLAADDGYIYAENSVHGNANIAVIFSGFTFRYAANVMNVGYYEEQIPSALHKTLNDTLGGLGLESIDAFSSGTLNQTLTFHTFCIGYRFYLTDSRWQPYIPLEVGAAVASGDALADKALYGATLATGLGLDVQLWGPLWAGLAVRYSFVITEGYPETAILGFSSSTPSFEAAVAMEHLLGVSAQLQVRY